MVIIGYYGIMIDFKALSLVAHRDLCSLWRKKIVVNNIHTLRAT